jgi:hypothetical protein
MLSEMRFATIAALCAASVLVLPASAARVEPKSLVLQQADVPAGFQLDRSRSRPRTSAELSRTDPKFVSRSGWLGGYLVQYVQPGGIGVGVQSTADLFRRPAGTKLMYARFQKFWRELSQAEPGARANIGTESWYYGGSVDTVVFWRYRRAFAFVLGVNMSKKKTLALARVQQRRMVAALG